MKRTYPVPIMAGSAKGKKSPTSKLKGHSLFKSQDKIGSFYFSVKWNCRGKKHIFLTLRMKEGVSSQNPTRVPCRNDTTRLCVCVCVGGWGWRVYPGFAQLGPLTGAAVIWQGVGVVLLECGWEILEEKKQHCHRPPALHPRLPQLWGAPTPRPVQDSGEGSQNTLST